MSIKVALCSSWHVHAQEYAEDVAERAKKRDNIFTRYSTLEDAIDEAERILSQEYVIALQPAPNYQMWTLKRLIMMML